MESNTHKPTAVYLIIKDACILTMDAKRPVLYNSAIAIDNHRIAAIDDTNTILKQYAAEQVIDATDCIIIPGLINAHTHIPMSYFKGLADDLPLDKWLNEYIWPLEGKLVKPDFVYDATLHGAAEMVKNGITLASDMYFEGDAMARAFIKAGVRCIIGEPLIEESGKTPLQDIGKLALDLLNKYKGNPLLDFSLAPHAIYTNGRDVLERCAEIAFEQNLLVHMHLSESRKEVEDCHNIQGTSPVFYLQDIGLLDTKLILAHGIWIKEEEMPLLAEKNASVVICTESNLKLGNGFTPIKNYLKHKVNLCFGTDGVASNNNLDLLAEMDLTAKVHKAIYYDPTFLPAELVLAMATINAAKAIHKQDELGSLEAGKLADITVLDCGNVEGQPLHNPYSQVVYALGGKAVRDVIINGEIVLRNKRLTRLDEAELVSKAKYYKAVIEKELPR